MKICVFGAGLIGCYVGTAWAKAGYDVSFIGRDEFGAALKQTGITLSRYDGWSEHLDADDVVFSSSPEALASSDLVILAVKSQATEIAAKTIATHVADHATVLSLQNGISNAHVLKQQIPEHIVLRGMVPFNVTSPELGKFHQGTKGNVIVEDHPRMEELQKHLSGSSTPLETDEDIASIQWGKLLLNLNNPINALSGLTLHQQLSNRDFRYVFSAAMREALEVMRQSGICPAKVTALPPSMLPGFINTPDFFFNSIGLKLQKIDKQARSSMAEDIAQGRKTEIDFLNGEVVKLAKSIGMQAPINEKICNLIKMLEKNPSLTFDGSGLREKIGV